MRGTRVQMPPCAHGNQDDCLDCKGWGAAFHELERDLLECQTALSYIASPTMGNPVGKHPAVFAETDASENSARYALALCINQARRVLGQDMIFATNQERTEARLLERPEAIRAIRADIAQEVESERLRLPERIKGAPGQMRSRDDVSWAFALVRDLIRTASPIKW